MESSTPRSEITSLNDNSFIGLSIEELDARLEMAGTQDCWFVVFKPPCHHQCGWGAKCYDVFCGIPDSNDNVPTTCCEHQCSAHCEAYCPSDCPCAGGGYCATYSCPAECPTHMPLCPAECPTLCVTYSCPAECPTYQCTTIYQS